MSSRRLLCLASLFLVSLPCLYAEDRPAFRPPAGQELISRVVYATRGDQQLHLEILRPKETPAKPMPVVLIIHGGGWAGGTHLVYAPWLVSEGFFTASVEYRLSGTAPWPAQIEDCRAAVRWLRAHAEEYHLDTDHFGCTGHSAGGHLVSCLGVLGEKTEFDLPGDHPAQSSRVQAVVDQAGPSDFSTESGPAVGTAPSNPGLTKLFGGTFEERPAIWLRASPARQVSPGTPPFLIFHGEEDHLVPIRQAELMNAALQKAGVPVEFVRVKNGGHGLRQDKPDGPAADPDNASIQKAIVAFFKKQLQP